MLTSDTIWLTSAALLREELADGRACELDLAMSVPHAPTAISIVSLANRTPSPAARLLQGAIKDIHLAGTGREGKR